jgi:hypothetical protein
VRAAVETPDWRPPPLRRKALLQLHCHGKSVLGAEAEHQVLREMGLKLEEPAVGCCGHAGAFGYEAEHYPVSIEIAEQVLLLAIRRTGAETIVIADGFSCRRQISDGAGRWAMHPAEIIALALDAKRSGVPELVDERRYLEPPAEPPKGTALAAAVAGAGLLVALLVSRRTPKR